MKTRIFFMRHGEVHNPGGTWYGRLPRMFLSKSGRRQIEEASQHFRNAQVDVIYSSPLLRARQTARILTRFLRLEQVTTSRRISEIKSHLQGRPFSFIKEIRGNFFADHIRKPDDETMDDILHRMVGFCKAVAGKHAGKNVIAVSHGDPLMILKSHVLNGKVTFESIRPGPDKYIKYGETYKITLEDENIVNISDEYKPL